MSLLIRPLHGIEPFFDNQGSDGLHDTVSLVHIKSLDKPALVTIPFQRGPVTESETGDIQGVNGVEIEHLLDIVIARLTFKGDAHGLTREESLARTHTQEALHWLEHGREAIYTQEAMAREIQGKQSETT